MIAPQLIPDQYSDDVGSGPGYWDVFLANCVLYDPPPTALLDFAARAGAEYDPPRSSSRVDLRAPDLMIEAYDLLWRNILAEVERRYLAPLNIDLHAMVTNCMWTTPQAWETYRQHTEAIPVRSFIEITPRTTKEEVLSDFQAITAEQAERPKAGRPPRDRLIAVQCANLRGEGWTDEQLAEYFDWEMGEDEYGKPCCHSAREHTKLGREILAEAHRQPT